MFGPHPRSYNIAMNRRARRAALAMAVAAKAADGALSVLDADDLKPVKTKELISVLWTDKSGSDSRVLLVLHHEKDAHAAAIALAGGNLRALTIVGHGEVNPHALLAHDRVIFTKNAYQALAEVCSA